MLYIIIGIILVFAYLCTLPYISLAISANILNIETSLLSIHVINNTVIRCSYEKN